MLKKYIISVLASLVMMTQVSAQTVLIKPGDTLSGLAKQYNTSVGNLVDLNKIQDPNKIYAGDILDIGGLIGANPLPSDNYDSYITAVFSASASEVFVNALPSGVTESIYTIFAQDGVTPREKIHCTGTSASPNKLTGCTRGVSFSPSSGVIRETSGTGVVHSKNARIAITDNINFSGKALAILNGSQETGSNVLLIGTTSTAGLKFDSGDYKSIAFGQTGSPFIRFNSSTGRWQFSDDGTNTTNFATSSAAGLSASTTAGIGITNSLIHMIVSSTQGMAFGSDGRLYIKTSSTLALAADSNGLYINTSTLVSLIATSTPTASKIPIADSYGNLPGFNSEADSITAGEPLNTNDVVYTSSTGSVYKYSSSTVINDTNLVGVVLATTSAASQAPVLFEGIVRTMSGLTAGSVYYTGTVSGTISATYTDQSRRLGVALSTTKLLLDKDKTKLYNAGVIAPASAVSGGSGTADGTVISVRLNAGEKVMVLAGGTLTASACDSASVTIREDSANTNSTCGAIVNTNQGCNMVYTTTTAAAAGVHTYNVRVSNSDSGNCTATWTGTFSVWKF